MRCAILMACHGRAKQTFETAASLRSHLPKNIDAKLYAVDDGCPEKSAEAAAEAWGGKTVILRSEQPRFWARSMALAEMEAKKKNQDFLLWCNQDTQAHSDLTPLFNPDAIVAATCTIHGLPAKGALAQAGNPCKFRLCQPGDTPATFNGNLVAIPERVFSKICIHGFLHAFADIDYGLRATQAGHQIKAGPVLSTTSPQRKNWRDYPTMAQRIDACLHPTGLPPEDWLEFCKRYGGPFWALRFLWAYRHLPLRRRRQAPIISHPLPPSKTEAPFHRSHS